MTELVRVVVADDHRLMHDVLRDLLESEGFEVVAAVRRGSEVLPTVSRTKPHLVLLERDLPELDGIAVLERLQRHHPEVVAVVLTETAAADDLVALFEAGASACISKAVAPALVGETLRRALQGRVAAPVGFASGKPEQGSGPCRLTTREIEILQLVAAGLSNASIAEMLFVTEQTVKFHLTNLYRKLGVANRTQAVATAYGLGMIDARDPLRMQLVS